MESIYRGIYLLQYRLLSYANEFYIPRATSFSALLTRLSSVSYRPKQSLPRVGHKTDLPAKKLCLFVTGCFLRAHPHSSASVDRLLGTFAMTSYIRCESCIQIYEQLYLFQELAIYYCFIVFENSIVKEFALFYISHFS